MDNIQFLNAIRAVSSAEYKERIPTATQTNIQNIMTTIMEYSTTKEEFIDLNGLGETTYNNYGVLFVNAIKEFYNN